MSKSFKNIKSVIVPIFFISLLIFSTYINFNGWIGNNDEINRNANGSFYWDVNDSLNVINKRLEVYADTLYGLRGVFAINNNLSRDKFETFINSQNTVGRYPGIVSISYVQKVEDKDLGVFSNSVKNDKSVVATGYPDFKVFPEYKTDQHFIVKYIEPYVGNEKGLGYDLMSDPLRKDIVTKTIDAGIPIASQPTQLFVDQGKEKVIGFGINLPIYMNGADVSTIEGKRANIIGIVSFSFRINEMMQNIFGTEKSYPNLNFKVYDTSISNENLIYTRENYSSANAVQTQKRNLDIAGRTWVFDYETNTNYNVNILDVSITRQGLVNGIIINFLILFILAYYMYRKIQRKKD